MEIVVEEIMQDKIAPDYGSGSQKVDIPKL
jgi:hypothetical protein